MEDEMKRQRAMQSLWSLWSLRVDLLSAELLVWAFTSARRDCDLTPEAHAYFWDRYRRLADWYRGRGRLRAAERAEANAAEHSDGDGPPYAAAMALPRPTHFFVTDAVSRHPLPPDDAA